MSFTPRPLFCQGRKPRYPLGRGLDGLQSWSGRGGEEKNFQPLPGMEPQSSHCIDSYRGFHNLFLEPSSELFQEEFFV
jgi:hypothetical protein